MHEDTRYDEREVGLILERVAELHARELEPGDAKAMTQAELEQVVSELGISPALVGRATTELAIRDQRNQASWWLGGKTDLLYERTVPGRVSPATHARMLEVLRRRLGDPGKLVEHGETRIWSTTLATTRRVHFTVVEHEGETSLRVDERMPKDARSTVGTASFLGGFAGFLALLPLEAVLIKSLLLLFMGLMAATGASLGWLLGRRLWARRSGEREAQLREAFAELHALAERAQPAPEEPPAQLPAASAR
ncbi:hypothetical protein G6O69_30985 [Pseudenhygromyxa sp. WMMC2535]|uniref:hypothetical protein n=1 Tax=Pseudenhygromyxa sp. WMMC2535 TaxID=2712867 RepID=UPI0015548D65|nr:hypothetical protein [Pseudenhygromyxa sp. WMMC2535]NVB42290.1 hypothetical protein [Pseudenhygromyxa sp. WMMC2535]